MRFAEKIFERATIRRVADYLLYGMIPERDERDYKARLDDADLAFEDAARQYGEDGASTLLSAANTLVTENASVYMELGLQAGILLISDILKNASKEFKPLKDNTDFDIISANSTLFTSSIMDFTLSMMYSSLSEKLRIIILPMIIPPYTIAASKILEKLFHC